MAPRATLHRAVISTFSPQMGGRAHDSSRQSIGCQISIVGPALRPLLRACSSRKRARFLPLDSHDTRRQPPLLSLIGCAHATPTSCICPYLTLNNPLLQAQPRASTPSPPRPRRRCRAKWRPPRPPSSERLTRPRRQLTSRCRACTVGWRGSTPMSPGHSTWRQELLTSNQR